jgi:hypothetical protein
LFEIRITRASTPLPVEDQARVLRAQRLHERAQAGERLAAAAVPLPPAHERGVEPDGGVVEEDALVRAADVDAALLAGERGQRRERVVAVEADVAGEVVASPERDADEGEIALDGDRRDRPERAVAARHPERPLRRGPRDLGGIVLASEHVRLDVERRRGGHELLGRRRVVAGAWVDEQEAGHGRSVPARPERHAHGAAPIGLCRPQVGPIGSCDRPQRRR